MSAQGPAVLFIHGLLGSSENWAQLMDTLGTENRLIAPDLFGHGSSAKPVGDYSLGAHAATVRDLLDQLGIETVTLVGHSLGGGIAMQFSYLFPERVERLVLVSSGGLGRELNLLLRSATLPGAELVLPVIASRWMRRIRGASPDGPARSQVGVRPNCRPERGLARVRLARASREPPGVSGHHPGGDRPGRPDGDSPPSPAPAVPVPVLLVWGARDRIIPSWHAVTGQQGFPGSRVEIFERAGHFPHLDQPERFAEVLREFISTS